MKYLLSVILVFSASCSSHRVAKTAYQEGRTAKSLAIATSEPLASAAAQEIYQIGGNIADAAVAASLAISVLRPQSTGLGGGGFLVYVPGNLKNKREAWDFREVAPLSATPDMYVKNGKAQTDLSQTGVLAVGVPGLIAGFWSFHKRHGKLPWATLFAPAIRLAEEGAPVSAHMAAAILSRQEDLLKSPELSALFVPEGRPLKEAEIFFQKDLAKTLRLLASNGSDELYRGEIGETISQFVQDQGGILRMRDFMRYRVQEREVLVANWNDKTVISMPPPSSGGIHVLQILKMVDYLKTSGVVLDPDPRLNLSLLEIEASKRAFSDRAMHLGDPDFHMVPTRELLSDSYLRVRANEIATQKIIPGPRVVPWRAAANKGPKQTTHLSFVDSDGNAISTTQTINTYFGAAVMAPGTGIVLNNEMDDFSIKHGVANAYGLIGGEANEIRPRKRPLSSMTPTIVLDSQNRPILATGAPGGSKIISSVYFSIARFLRDGETPEVAISSCRFHHQWVPDKVSIETRCGDLKEKLKKFYVAEDSSPFGELQMAGFDSQGRLFAVSDPRGHGQGIVVSYGKNR